MSNICYQCGQYLASSYASCPNCKMIAANERNTDEITRALFIQTQVIAETTEKNQRATNKLLLESIQQSITDDHSYKLGYKLDFLHRHPRAFIGSMNEKGEINIIDYENPFVLDRLMISYDKGVFDRIRFELNDSLLIPGAEMKLAECAYEAGKSASTSICLVLPIPFMENIEISTRNFSIANEVYYYDEKSFSYVSDFYKIQSPFESEALWNRYLNGLSAFLKELNSPEKLLDRKHAYFEEVKLRKDERKSKFIGYLTLPLILIFIAFLLSIVNP